MDIKNLTNSFSSISSTKNVEAQSASSLFMSTDKDSLLALDQYGRSIPDVLNNMHTGIMEKLSQSSNWLLNTKIADWASINDALGMAASAKAEAEKYAALTNQITASVKQNISSLSGMRTDIQNEVLSKLGILNQNPFDQIQREIKTLTGQIGGGGDVEWDRIIQGASVQNVNDVVDLSNRVRLPDQPELERYADLNAQVALDASILTNASKLGIAPVIDHILEKYPDNAEIRQTFAQTFPDAIQSGDLTVINKVIDHLGRDYLLGKFPQACQQVIQYYRFPLGSTANDYPDYATELVETLSRLNPEWDTVPGAYHQEGNLSVFERASTDTKKIVSLLPQYAYRLKVVNHFSTSTPLNVIAKTQYPLSGI